MKTHLVGIALFLLAGVPVAGIACSSGTGTPAGIDAGSSGTGTVVSGVGDPCTPAQEKDATFNAFDEKEVSIETSSPSCATSVCLLNHFRGRVSCPYGQDITGKGAVGGASCKTPDTMTPVTGDPTNVRKALVPPQCVDRKAALAVYCSCRCANGEGKTDDGATYCACPSGFACTSVVSSIGASTKDIAGSYCIKQGTAYDLNTACNQGDCDPVAKKCD